MGTKIYFLIPYALKTTASQRFRFEQYFSLLQTNGFEFHVSCFLDPSTNDIFSRPGNLLVKVSALLRGYWYRCRDLFRVSAYDFVFIHREASPLGPPLFEWVLHFILKKKIIYDFDDALWLTDKRDERSIERWLKWRTKVSYICRWAYKISCSNSYLHSYASLYNQNVIVLPSTVDTDSVHNPILYPEKTQIDSITIGWTGSYSTLKYLNAIENVINEIEEEFPQVSFLVIADRRPALQIPRLRFIKWKAATEIADLLQIDIGIMPLPNDPWTKGKSGFKCIQYMALKIPAVASSVGVNPDIIDNNENGYLVRNDNEWKGYLVSLITNLDQRELFGEAGRRKVVKAYSVTAHSASFLSLFK